MVRALVLGTVAAIIAMPAAPLPRRRRAKPTLGWTCFQRAGPARRLRPRASRSARGRSPSSARARTAIFHVSLVTGEGSTFSEGPGTPSLGMKVDPRGRLFVAGGRRRRTSDRRAHRRAARLLRVREHTDVRERRRRDPGRRLVHGLAAGAPLQGPARPGRQPAGPSRRSPASARGRVRPRTGTNANGIARPPTTALLIVQTATGLLFRVDPATGDATQVDLGGAVLTAGDGCSCPVARSSSCRTGSTRSRSCT